jgi:hypothetical protein
MQRALFPLVATLAIVLSIPVSAQRGRGAPGLTLPEISEQEKQQSKPVFRTGVTRVEVSALVLDRNGEPVRGLTAGDFEVLENGVPQTIRSFIPFTYRPGGCSSSSRRTTCCSWPPPAPRNPQEASLGTAGTRSR